MYAVGPWWMWVSVGVRVVLWLGNVGVAHMGELELGLCKGKREYDKRDAIRERDEKRNLAQARKDAQRR